jgi:hypothetical protein
MVKRRLTTPFLPGKLCRATAPMTLSRECALVIVDQLKNGRLQ